jgi:hypothetical protein
LLKLESYYKITSRCDRSWKVQFKTTLDSRSQLPRGDKTPQFRPNQAVITELSPNWIGIQGKIAYEEAIAAFNT